MKKILSILFVFLLFLVLCGCNKEQKEIVAEEPKTEVQEEKKDEQSLEPKQVEEVKEESPEPTSETSIAEVKEVATSAYIDPNGYLGQSEEAFTSALSNLGFYNVVKGDPIYSGYPEGTICYYLPDGEQPFEAQIVYKLSLGKKPEEQAPVQQEVQQNVQEEKPKKEHIIISDVVERVYEPFEDGSNPFGYVRRTVTYAGEEHPFIKEMGVWLHRTQDENGNWYDYVTEEDWQNTEEYVRNVEIIFYD